MKKIKGKSPAGALIISVLFGFFGFLYLEEMKKFWTWAFIVIVGGTIGWLLGSTEPLVIFWLIAWGLTIHDAIQLE